MYQPLHPDETEHLGEVSSTEHRINLEPGTRRSLKVPYGAGHNSCGLIKAEIERKLAQGVIETAMSEWVRAVVIALKHDGSAQFYVDY